MADSRKVPIIRQIWQKRYIYLLLLPGVVYFSVFCYAPMYGLLLAFKRFNASMGILRSPFIGLANFERIFITSAFYRAFQNTLIISFSRLLIEFPSPIILALLINEMRGKKLKRVYQTIYTFPNFLSWVIVATILSTFLSNAGAVNGVLNALGFGRFNFLANLTTFRGILYATSIWKNAGWSAIIFMAAIAGINPELYEAAVIDGAGRLRNIWHITLPGIMPTVVVMFILSIGNVMNAGFDQIFNLSNAVVMPVSDIIDTYVYSITFGAVPNYGFSTAVGMFKSVINLCLLLSANYLVKYVSGHALF